MKNRVKYYAYLIGDDDTYTMIFDSNNFDFFSSSIDCIKYSYGLYLKNKVKYGSSFVLKIYCINEKNESSFIGTVNLGDYYE